MVKVITLANLAESTAQEVYDFVKDRLLAQGRKSFNGEVCVYKSPEGLHCAAGFIIGDDYDPAMEKCVWLCLVREKRVPDAHDRLIMDLQMVHDRERPDDWVRELALVARQYKLNP
jgi:hypothetical protein